MTIKRQKQRIGKEGIFTTNVKMKVMNKEGVKAKSLCKHKTKNNVKERERGKVWSF
jgi:hypothetical protein